MNAKIANHEASGVRKPRAHNKKIQSLDFPTKSSVITIGGILKRNGYEIECKMALWVNLDCLRFKPRSIYLGGWVHRISYIICIALVATI